MAQWLRSTLLFMCLIPAIAMDAIYYLYYVKPEGSAMWIVAGAFCGTLGLLSYCWIDAKDNGVKWYKPLFMYILYIIIVFLSISIMYHNFFIVGLAMALVITFINVV